MSDIEGRLRYLEDRVALQDLITSYCRHLDELEDLERVAECFTEDALLDLSGLDLPVARGKSEIRAFFKTVFESMQYEAHYSTNFTIEDLQENTARCFTYVIGHGLSKTGVKALVHAKHVFHCLRTDSGWKISHFEEPLLVPLPDKLEALYE